MPTAWVGKARGNSTAQAYDLALCRQALSVLTDGQGFSQVQGIADDQSWGAPSRIFNAADPEALERALAYVGGYDRVQILINPCAEVPSGAATRTGDIQRRRWLMLDIDAARPNTKIMATEAERLEAQRAADRVRMELGERGWPAPVIIDSGNGRQLLYRVDLPNDKYHRAVIAQFLKKLGERLGMPPTVLDTGTAKANQACKLPGSTCRKGPCTDERPWRPVVFADLPPVRALVGLDKLLAVAGVVKDPKPATEPAAEANGRPTSNASPFQGKATDGDAGKAWAKGALKGECGNILKTTPGGLNTQMNTSAYNVGRYVGSGLLDKEVAFADLMWAARAAGADNPSKDADTIRRGLEAGALEPLGAPERQQREPSHWSPDQEPAPDVDPADVATIHDLIAAGAQVQWLWQDWIQIGVLTAIAAPGGTGKTRFCGDLLRRIRHQLGWPDGQAVEVPADSLALWVVADNHHDEMVDLARDFDIVDSIRINAPKAEPYSGVSLETLDDLKAIEARIKAVKPVLVIVDTVGNATDKNLSRQEDAKAFYWPLQVMARQYRCAVLALTHLNANGQFLGRRVMEKVRTAIRIEQPNEDDPKRRVEVLKSNSKKPGALGMLLGDHGSEYDFDPPDRVTDEPGKGGKKPVTSKVQEAVEWLQGFLAGSIARKVSDILEAAERKGFSVGTTYRARKVLQLVEYVRDGRKWWRKGVPGEVLQTDENEEEVGGA